jgi:hypothetical protein
VNVREGGVSQLPEESLNASYISNTSESLTSSCVPLVYAG